MDRIKDIYEEESDLLAPLHWNLHYGHIISYADYNDLIALEAKRNVLIVQAASNTERIKDPEFAIESVAESFCCQN